MNESEMSNPPFTLVSCLKQKVNSAIADEKRHVHNHFNFSWDLPARGKVGLNCGETVMMRCNSCGYAWEGKRSCLRRECPNCGVKWASIEARLASSRLWVGKRKLGHGRLLHVIVSPPVDIRKSLVGIDDIRQLRKCAYDVCEKHGIVGGVCLIHPYRKNKITREYSVEGLHFHITGFAPGNVEPGTGEDGWIFKVVRDARRKDYRGFETYRDLRLCLRYELSHAGIVDKLHGLTWWGVFSYNNLNKESIESLCPEAFVMPKKRCPVCNSEDITEVFYRYGEWVSFEFEWTSFPPFMSVHRYVNI